MSAELIDSICIDIKKRFALDCRVEGTVEGGWINRKWQVAGNGNRYLVKEFSPKRYKDSKLEMVKKSLEVQYRLGQSDSVCPEILKSENQIIQQCGTAKYMVMSYLDGYHKDYVTISDDE